MYQSIQASRAIAAILVVCYHTAGNLHLEKYFGSSASGLESLFLFGGTAGVDFFFVLSGFIMILVHRKDFGSPRRVGQYLRKRAVRIYPPYVIIFLSVFLIAQVIPGFSEGMPSDPATILKSLLLIPQDPAQVGGTGAPVIIVAWTLQYEIVFYAAIGVAILSRWAFAVLLAAYVTVFVLNTVGGPLPFPGWFFGSHLLMLFLIGALVGSFVISGRTVKRPRVVAVVGGVMFACSAVLANLFLHAWPQFIFDYAFGISSGVAVLGLVLSERERPGLFSNRLASLLGDSSYVLYLLHFPLVALLSKVAVGVGLRGTGGATLAFLAIVVAVTGVAVAFHLLIESPLLRALSGRRVKRSPEVV